MTPKPLENENDADEARVRQLMEPDHQGRPGDMVVPESGTPASAPELPSADEPSGTEPAAPAPAPASDEATDTAVDDITKHEADDSLRLQDQAVNNAAEAIPPRQHRLKQFWTDWWGSPRGRWGTAVAVVVIILGLFAVPVTRYQLLGLVLKHPVTVHVLDSKTHAPVSGARVELNGQTAETAADGTAKLSAHLGSHTLTVSKKYYQTVSSTRTVTLSAANDTLTTTLLALGRQVSVKVINKVTGQPLANAIIDINHAHTKTNADGTVTVVVPSSASVQAATVSLDGYNSANVSITVGDHLLSKNTFRLTPAGKLYFLSNLSGTIDVVKTNLDGTDRQTVLKGTGNEDRYTTSLLASRDWKYLALLSKRAGSNATLYLIDTTNGDKLMTIDEGNTFNLIGWSGHHFVYQIGHLIKSFDADSGNTIPLANASVASSSDASGKFQTIWDAILDGNQLFYDMTWYQSPGYLQVPGKQNTLLSINVDGTNSKVLKSVDAAQFYFSNLKLYKPGQLYFGVYSSTNTNTTYYKLDASGNITQSTTITGDSLNQTYPTDLVSPSGSQTFWSEQRDGKNTLLVGDDSGNNGKQVATLSDYSPYGWYSDKYLLVSKNGSELYIMPVAGGAPLKITDYYKPAINYQGYGGGYGGL